jgi:RNA polymerase sigma factor (sigma-70 family)
LKSLANTTALSTFFASPAVKIHQIKKHVLFNSRPLGLVARRYLNDEAEMKDVLQDSFVQLFQKLQQFDEARASFKTWSSRIVINNCLKRNAKNERLVTVELTPEAHAPAINPEVLTTFDNKELTNWLKQMPTEYYEVFNLSVVEGYNHAEIAHLLGIDAPLSRQRLSRARKWLSKACQSDESSPLRADFVNRNRFKVVPLAITILAFIEHMSS